MVRTIAGAVLLLLIVFFARGRPHILRLHAVAQSHPSAADSLRPAVPGDSSTAPSPKKSRREPPSVPEAFSRHPLAFLSRAPADSLVLLNGIGPVLAERIVETRNGKGPFSSWKEILAVKGIGPGKLERLKAQAGVVD